MSDSATVDGADGDASANDSTGGTDERELTATALRPPHRRRVEAFGIDAAVVAVVFGLAVALDKLTGLPGPGIAVAAVVAWVYYVGATTWLMRGRTAGKAICQLRSAPVGADDVPRTFRRLVWSVGRHTIGYVVVDVLLLGTLFALMNRRRRCLHDYVFVSEVTSTAGSQDRPASFVERYRAYWEECAERYDELTSRNRWFFFPWKWLSKALVVAALVLSKVLPTGSSATAADVQEAGEEATPDPSGADEDSAEGALGTGGDAGGQGLLEGPSDPAATGELGVGGEAAGVGSAAGDAGLGSDEVGAGPAAGDAGLGGTDVGVGSGAGDAGLGSEGAGVGSGVGGTGASSPGVAAPQVGADGAATGVSPAVGGSGAPPGALRDGSPAPTGWGSPGPYTPTGVPGGATAGIGRGLAVVGATVGLVTLVFLGGQAIEGDHDDERAQTDDLRSPVDEVSTSTTEQQPMTTTTEQPTTTTTVPSVVEAEVMPFVTCDTSEPLEFLAEVSVLDPVTGDQEVLISGLPGICNGNAGHSYPLGETMLTASGRYLVSLWDPVIGEPSFNVVDLTIGSQAFVAEAELDAWATAETGTGLDAAERSLELVGFDRSGDGRIFFAEDDGDGPRFGPLLHYSQDVPDLVSGNGSLSPVELPDERRCYRSTRWSRDGSHCLFDTGSATGSNFIVPTSDVFVWSDDAFEQDNIHDHDYAYFTGGLDRSDFLDATTVIGSDGYAKEIFRSGIGQEGTTLYEITGDRSLRPWINSTTGTVYFVSPTLDGSATEIYEASAQPGAEPELITTMPANVGVLNN